MRIGRFIAGTSLSMIIIGSALVAPALDARELGRTSAFAPDSGFSIASFTPANADASMARVLTKRSVSVGKFRFTPAESSGGESRAIIVTARSSQKSSGGSLGSDNIITPSAVLPSGVSIAPIEYNLGVASSWKRTAKSNDVTRIDLGALPLGQENFDLNSTFKTKRGDTSASTRTIRTPERAAALSSGAAKDLLDVGGAYALTRNLDVTAGVRYKAERDRLLQPQDRARDSQSVYIGTAFRF